MVKKGGGWLGADLTAMGLSSPAGRAQPWVNRASLELGQGGVPEPGPLVCLDWRSGLGGTCPQELPHLSLTWGASSRP